MMAGLAGAWIETSKWRQGGGWRETARGAMPGCSAQQVSHLPWAGVAGCVQQTPRSWCTWPLALGHTPVLRGKSDTHFYICSPPIIPCCL